MYMTKVEELRYLHNLLGQAVRLAELSDGDVANQLRNIVCDRADELMDEPVD